MLEEGRPALLSGRGSKPRNGRGNALRNAQNKNKHTSHASSTSNSLNLLRKKQAAISALLSDMGMEAVEQRLQDALESPPPGGGLAHAVAVALDAATRRGARGPALFVELPDSPPGAEGAAQTAELLIRAGVDGLVVPAAPLSGGEGVKVDDGTALARLVAAARAAAAAAAKDAPAKAAPSTTGGPPDLSGIPIPVLARDWIVHPLQLAEAKAAGAGGVLGASAAVLGRGASILTAMGAAMGLDVPLEVVNRSELEAGADGGTPLFAVNVSLGLSVAASIPGAAAALAAGILEGLPPGAAALVGVTTPAGAAAAAAAGAAGLVVKREYLLSAAVRGLGLAAAVEEARDASSED